MREWLDKSIALIGTVLLHGVLIALLVTNVQWQAPEQIRPAMTIKATVIDDAAFALADAALGEKTQEAVPQVPTPPPEVDNTQALIAEQAAQAAAEREREQVAERQKKAERQREADAAAQRQRDAAEQQRQAEQDAARVRDAAEAAERQKRDAEAAQQQREAKAAAERERQAAEDAERKRKAAAEVERKRKEAEAAERKRKAEAQRREAQRQSELDAQLRDAMIAEEARQGAINSGLLAQYVELIRQDVERAWTKPIGVPDGIRCEVRVRQLRSGEVVSVRVVDCAGGEVLIRSIEQAVYKASPLPLPPDASLFEANLRFPFKTGE